MLGDLAAEVAEHLIGLPLDYGTTVEQIAALLAAEPRNRPSVCAVTAVIVDDALRIRSAKPPRTVGVPGFRPGSRRKWSA